MASSPLRTNRYGTICRLFGLAPWIAMFSPCRDPPHMSRRIGDLAKLCYPVIQNIKGLGVEPVHAVAAGLLAAHQSGPAQYPQMLRYSRLADAERTPQVFGRVLRIAQQIQDG